MLTALVCAANAREYRAYGPQKTATFWLRAPRAYVGCPAAVSRMNSTLHIPLDATPEAVQRLLALQQGFAKLCNALAPLVQQSRVWNRVALHHLAYRQLREQFPEMGSQMVCNAIYSVSRTGRLVFQHPQSPFNVARLGDKPLPLLCFSDNCPVYFDRHTLSLKEGQLSMFTMDGRLHFQLRLSAQDEARFHAEKLREVVLSRQPSGVFALTFQLAPPSGMGQDAAARSGALAQTDGKSELGAGGEIPSYVVVKHAPSFSNIQAIR